MFIWCWMIVMILNDVDLYENNPLLCSWYNGSVLFVFLQSYVQEENSWLVSGVAPTRKHPCRISPSCHLASWTGWSLSWDTCCDCRMKFHWTLRPNNSCASCDYLWTSMCFLLGWIRFELAMFLSAFCISSVVIRDPSLRTIYPTRAGPFSRFIQGHVSEPL